jgi:ribonuclease HI
MQNKILIFSDGSSKGNPGPGGWGAIILLPNGRVKELGGNDKHTTNNRMELKGAIYALEALGNAEEEIILNTDSSYVINGITKWVFGWQKNNWKTLKKEDVVNKDLWEELIATSKNKKIKWNYVGGHIGISGNERCDVIATSFADLKLPELFEGDISKYKFNLHDIKGSEIKKKSKSHSRAEAYSYLSLVRGLLKIHKTWNECEKRVKGVKGAKFKKAIDKNHEEEIIREWQK